jgi:ribulose-phosphate 3-epimerase
MEYMLIPAIIAVEAKELLEKVHVVKKEVSRIHIDIMDGAFVPRESNWFSFSLPEFKGEYEAHLMVKDVLSWMRGKTINQFDTVIIHAEAGSHDLLRRMMFAVKQKKKTVILAFNPETPWENYLDFLHHVDGVQIMCVRPGNYGASFIARTIEKVKKLREHFPKMDIRVDGAMHEKHIALAKNAGANLFVVGGRIFRSSDPLKSLWDLEKTVK